MTPRIRLMRPSDVGPAAAEIVRDQFGDRQAWLEFATSFERCHAVVAVVDDRIVGTGVGTLNGRVGWLGALWVRSDHRRRGVGRALTEAVTSALVDGGARTLVLVSSEAGRPLYERIGFRIQTWYDTFEAPPEAADATPDPRTVRSYRRGDLEAVTALDAAATGEDRSAVLRRFARPATARVVVRDGAVRGYVIRAPWGGAATIAETADDALRLIAARRAAAAPDRRVRVSIVRENEAGREALLGAGFAASWSAPRLVRGERLRWQPERLWGQFNMAMG